MSKPLSIFISIGLILLSYVFLGAQTTQPEKHIVTSAADRGLGSLRQALLDTESGDTITFDQAVFPPEDPTVISLTNPLPAIVQGNLTIDASQAGVILDGSNTPDGSNGFEIVSNGNSIKGLQIINFPESGVWIHNGAQNNTIGGENTSLGESCTGDCNLVSGNGINGVQIEGLNTEGNVVAGNYIGTNTTGDAALPNGIHGVSIRDGAIRNLIGGDRPQERNLISGNRRIGVEIYHANDNSVSGNYIGTDVSGTQAVSNGYEGVSIGTDSSGNDVGGSNKTPGKDCTGECNLISGNQREGVWIGFGDTSHNTLSGNYIGTDASGTTAIGNYRDGIHIETGPSQNLIGGDTPGERNIISGNLENGIGARGAGTMRNSVQGNYIGTDASGTKPLGNGLRGVFLFEGAQYNTVVNNVISGNGNDGVPVEGEGTDYNVISGNLIGTDYRGEQAIPNALDGVFIAFGAQYNIIKSNLISGNHQNGIHIQSSGTMNNTVSGNSIGTDASGKELVGNVGVGIQVHDGASENMIGGSTPEEGNLIRGNGSGGIQIAGRDTIQNLISHNAITQNGQFGIQISDAGNKDLPSPEITFIGSRLIEGETFPEAMVEVFSDDEDQGRVFEGSSQSDGEGFFRFQMPVGRFTGPNVTATGTDPDGNTSPFSEPAALPVSIVSRELQNIVAPTQVSVEPAVVGTNLILALVSVLFFGFISTIFNSILEDYRDDILNGFGRIIPHRLAASLSRVENSIRSANLGGWRRVLLTWVVVLLFTAIIESFLDPDLAMFSTQRLALIITLSVSAVIVNAFELGSDLFARRRYVPKTEAETKVHWIGILIAIVCVLVSRALDFRPGYLLGVAGAVYLTPKLVDRVNCGKRAAIILVSIFLGGFVFWAATLVLPVSLAVLEPILLMIFLLSLQVVFFELFPLTITYGCDIWGWRRGMWLGIFTIVFFCFYHFLLNPDAPDVQALQQNGVQTLVILLGIFGLATLTMWLLFPFRLRMQSDPE